MRLMKGTRRRVLLIGRWAIKIPRTRLGLLCNQREVRIWKNAQPNNRWKLCPVVGSLPFGIAIVMPITTPVTLEERDACFNDPERCEVFHWSREPSGNYAHLESKPEDLGWLNGAMVNVDYGEPLENH
jgi:hypothetical protein